MYPVYSVPPKPQLKALSPYPCSCLASVQYWLPWFPVGVGSPRNLEPNSLAPVIGGAILLDEGPVDHIGKTLDYTLTSVTFQECNYTPCKCGIRTLQLTDSVIRGYVIHDSPLLPL